MDTFLAIPPHNDITFSTIIQTSNVISAKPSPHTDVRYSSAHASLSHRVVAVDMRGYADSDKPPGMSNYTLDKLAEDVRDLVIALGQS